MITRMTVILCCRVQISGFFDGIKSWLWLYNKCKRVFAYKSKYRYGCKCLCVCVCVNYLKRWILSHTHTLCGAWIWISCRCWYSNNKTLETRFGTVFCVGAGHMVVIVLSIILSCAMCRLRRLVRAIFRWRKLNTQPQHSSQECQMNKLNSFELQAGGPAKQSFGSSTITVHFQYAPTHNQDINRNACNICVDSICKFGFYL